MVPDELPKTSPRQGQAGIDQHDATGRSEGGDELTDESACLTGVHRSHPGAPHSIPMARTRRGWRGIHRAPPGPAFP
jgi:hypothetical protein